MKNMSWRTAVLYACVFLFACLLISGAPRLISTQQEEAPPVRIASGIAYLCSAPSQTQEVQPSTQEQLKNEKRTDDARITTDCQGNPSITLKKDANGNILFHRSYLKTVYQAFSLGDGFA